MTDFFAGIGSRSTPQDVVVLMGRIATYLTKTGMWLRSGGCVGADKAFESGVVNDRKEIYYKSRIGQVARQSVAWFHPRPDLLLGAGSDLMARNLYQITGREVENSGEPIHQYGMEYDCPPKCPDDLEVLSFAGRFNTSKLVICYTRDGCNDGYKTTIETGGTGQALRIAAKLSVPIYNLKNSADLDALIRDWMPGFDKPDYVI